MREDECEESPDELRTSDALAVLLLLPLLLRSTASPSPVRGPVAGHQGRVFSMADHTRTPPGWG